MKKQILILGMLLFSGLIYSQTKVDSLVQAGIQYHDNRQFDKAIEVYKAALKIEPASPLVHYEIALSYMQAKDYKNSIKHCDLVIKQNDKYLLMAYITKASSLDYMGQPREAIKLFEKGIKKFGDHHLLYYNLGYTHYNLNEYDKAEEALVNAINTKPNHSSSHLLLGFLMSDKNQRVQSALSLHYFLFLEPNTERSKTAYNLLQKEIGGNVQRDIDKPNQINIFIDPSQSDSDFGPADMMLSMLEASKSIEENKSKSEDELFIENTTSFFEILGELKKKKYKGLWWKFYVPFFYDMVKTSHMDTYCYYISQSSSTAAIEWLENNAMRTDEFDQWLRSQ